MSRPYSPRLAAFGAGPNEQAVVGRGGVAIKLVKILPLKPLDS